MLIFERGEWGFLFFLIGWIAYVFIRHRLDTRYPRLWVSSSVFFDGKPLSKDKIKRREWLLFAIRLLMLSALLLGAMRPILQEERRRTDIYGIDITIALDVSESMKQKDHGNWTRIEVAKRVLHRFIERRKHDRMGLILFARSAFVQSPQTLEKEILLSLLKDVEIGMIDPRKTAIGEAVLLASERLLRSKAKTRIIILITDGKDTAPEKIRPEFAADLAKEVGIKIYTIGIGKRGGRQVDFDLLSGMAKKTGGKFYYASSETFLEQAMADIDKLEKTKIKRTSFKVPIDVSSYFLYAFLVLFGLHEIIARLWIPNRLDL